MVYLHQSNTHIQTEYIDLKYSGNIIPNSLYTTLTTASGRPDHIAISVLAETIYWYKPNYQNLPKFNGDAWRTSYSYFEKKFNTSKESIRRAFVRLEKLGFIKRELRTITIRGQRYNNVLFIHLYKESLNFCTPIHKNKEVSSQKVGDIYKDYRENNKNRYLYKEESNFENLNLKIHSDKTQSKEKVETTKFFNNENLLKHNPFKAKLKSLKFKNETPLSKNIENGIKAYLPLPSKEVELLTNKVGRDFGSTFINALARKLGDKYPDHSFYSKEAFLNYMAKALENEMHDPVKVNNINFAYGLSDEQFLTSIEASNDTSDIGKIKRRIAQEFESSTAAKILRMCKFPKVLPNYSKYKIYINDESFVLENFIKEKLERIIIETTKRVDQETGKEKGITKVIFEQSKADILHCNSVMDSNSLALCAEDETRIDPIWLSSRRKLKQIYGEGIDKSWFSKIKFDLDRAKSKIMLEFESKFMQDWFITHYQDKVCSTLEAEFPDLKEVLVKIVNVKNIETIWNKSWFKKASNVPKDFNFPMFLVKNFVKNATL